MRVFIVRPFGIKEGIDFDRVEAELLRPALDRMNRADRPVEGATTGDINRAGNIREDMFRRLVASDLVIADVSIHNANVFYELGIRHGLQPFATFMLRSRATEASYPFDLQTDRYFLYDGTNPGADVDALVAALESTLAAAGVDSPVFRLLPQLKAHPRGDLIRPPRGFVDEVERARRLGSDGDLRLLAHEAQGFEWESEGLRLVGDTQFKLAAFDGARRTFEALRRSAPDDWSVNHKLATIYQKLSNTASKEHKETLLACSDEAIERALKAASLPAEMAESHALKGSNAKTRWIEAWSTVSIEAERRKAALESPHLDAALGAYLTATAVDLNAYFPAINALGLLNIQIELAKAMPNLWAGRFDDDASAMDELRGREATSERLAAALPLVLGTDRHFQRGNPDPPDRWAALSAAELALVSGSRAERVAAAYRSALRQAERFYADAARRNVAMYQALGMFGDRVDAALTAIDEAALPVQADGSQQVQAPTSPRPDRVLLFTGHMIDAEQSKPPRFPRTPLAESKARALIEEAVRGEAQPGERLLGFAGGACGSDILFHETCATLGVPTTLMLALPQDLFEVTSVQRGGAGWIERYRALCKRLNPRSLQQSEALPDWLVGKPGYDVWQRNNLWVMFHALATGATDLTLIALFNPDVDPRGQGGTADMVATARAHGFKPLELDARVLLK
jgi:hypothetical protein